MATGQDLSNQNKQGVIQTFDVTESNPLIPDKVADAEDGTPSQARLFSAIGFPQATYPVKSLSKRIEHFNSMRQALFAQEGWSGDNVSQANVWSSEPAMGDADAARGGAPLSEQRMKDGTDVWEANLRKGGQTLAQDKAAWGETHTTNIGGTSGGADETTDSRSVWTSRGGHQGAVPGGSQSSWQADAQRSPTKSEWGSGPGVATAGALSFPAGNSAQDSAGPMTESRVAENEPNRDMGISINDSAHIRNSGGVMRGVSGRLSCPQQMWTAQQPLSPPASQLPRPGQSEDGLAKGWKEPLPPTRRGNSYDERNSFWGQQAKLPLQGQGQWHGHQESSMLSPGRNPSGWEEQISPARRRNNVDDGTSLWGPPTKQFQPAQGKGQWYVSGQDKGMVDMGSKTSGWEKPPPPPYRRSAHGDGTSHWGQLGQQATLSRPAQVAPYNISHWSEPYAENKLSRGNIPSASNMSGPRMSSAGPARPAVASTWDGQAAGPSRHSALDHNASASWGDDTSKLPSYGSTGGGAWSIRGSREFRLLCQMNYMKEDVEVALHTTNMNFTAALELLSACGRRNEKFDQSMMRGAGLNPVQPFAYADGASEMAQNCSQISNATGQVGGQPGLMQSELPQTSAKQLKSLIQQVQMAVQNGFLDHKMLNESLTPATLHLVNHLLQQIKILQQLNQRFRLLHMNGQIQPDPYVTVSFQREIQKVEQNILHLQTLIREQQANYSMQERQAEQQQQLAPEATGGASADLFNSPFSDPLAAFGSFPDKTIMPTFPTQARSRLIQWKWPPLVPDGSDFQHAPGTAPPAEKWSLGDQSDAETLPDFIPEFEPGKPWKGT